jgi:hypothetical protein
MYGQDRLINPTSTFLELNNDIPTYKCDTFDIDQMVEMSKNDLLNGVSPLRFAKKFAVSLTPLVPDFVRYPHQGKRTKLLTRNFSCGPVKESSFRNGFNRFQMMPSAPNR